MKFKITDESGNQFEVEEIITEDDADAINNDVTTEDDNTTNTSNLTADEIVALKELAKVVPNLLALIQKDETDNAEDDEIITDNNDGNEENDEDDEDTNVQDSKRSFGSLEKRKQFDDSELVDSVASAWSKRGIGGNR